MLRCSTSVLQCFFDILSRLQLIFLFFSYLFLPGAWNIHLRFYHCFLACESARFCNLFHWKVKSILFQLWFLTFVLSKSRRMLRPLKCVKTRRGFLYRDGYMSRSALFNVLIVTRHEAHYWVLLLISSKLGQFWISKFPKTLDEGFMVDFSLLRPLLSRKPYNLTPIML